MSGLFLHPAQYDIVKSNKGVGFYPTLSKGSFLLENVRLVLLIILVILIALSAFFSGSETAFLSFSKVRLRHMARQGDKRAKMLHSLLKRPERVLGTILVGNNFVNIAAAAIATYLASYWLGSIKQGVILVTVGLTLVILVFGEISPKTFSATHPEKVSFFVLPVINGLMVILAPVVKVVVFASNLLLRLFRARQSEFFPSLSEEEIHSVIHMGYEEGVVAKDKRRMLSNILKMSKTRVRQVMVPRTMVTVVDINAHLSEVMEVIKKSGYSRFPVYQGTPEEIIGLVHAKDVLKSWGDRVTTGLKEIVRKPYFVPESAKIEGILLDLQKEKVHLAMVVDEYGGFEGIITLEDILEEIVGEIRDEYDREAEQMHFLPDGSVLVEGRINIQELNERLHLELFSSSESTLAGLIMANLGRIPERGEVVVLDHLKMKVEDISRHTIKKIRITGLRNPEQPKP